MGDTITFGRYPQIQKEIIRNPIEWLVLERDGNKALLISKYGLDAQSYHLDTNSVTWETCTLRTWLNRDFLQSAFSEEEQRAILTTEVDNSKEQGYIEWDTPGGNNSQDKIFLLSYAEAKKYLDVTAENSDNLHARVKPTIHAIKNGAYASENSKTADDDSAGWWWLRSPGDRPGYAAGVYIDGSLHYINADNSRGCVRPVLWIDLDALPPGSVSVTTPELTPEPTPIPTLDPTPTLTPTATPTATPESTPSIAVGDTLTFGRYPQTAEGTDSTPIEWIVLDRDGDNVLLLSKYGLDVIPYNTKKGNITWENCTLRTWLNRDFLQATFTREEQSAIPTVTVDNSPSQGFDTWKTNGGNDTQDQIFLLSYSQVYRYFNVEYAIDDPDARTKPTARAIANGAHTNSQYETEDGAASCYWWLRSPGYYQYHATFVSTSGSLGYDNVNTQDACVRPALWLNLNKYHPE